MLGDPARRRTLAYSFRVAIRRTTSDIYGGRDPHVLPAYPLIEAAHYLKMPPSTLRAWSAGQAYTVRGERRMARPLIQVAGPKDLTLSFVNLIEVHVLRALRTKHELSMTAVRGALLELERRSPVEHPLAYENLLAGAGDVFLEKYGQLISLTNSGQVAIRIALEAFLTRVERDQHFAPVRLYPFIRSTEIEGRRTVAVDPRVSFGRPVLSGTRIPTAEIRGRVDAGETPEEVAADLDQEITTIQDAIVYEQGLAA